MKKILFGLIVAAQLHAQEKPVKFVDPIIGSDGHGHVFVGANVPFGAVQVGPTQIVKGWDWCSGYHYSDSLIIGFSQTHLSGTGIGDLGDVMLMPYSGKLKLEHRHQNRDNGGFGAIFSHKNEKAEAGYYAVNLPEVKVRLTASERVGYHQYHYKKNENRRVAVDLFTGIGWDRPTDTYIKQVDANTFVGYRMSSGWAVDQRLWFAIKTSVPIKNFGIVADSAFVDVKEKQGRRLVGQIDFGMGTGKVEIKVGISPVSFENALNNIQAEIPGWNFENIKLLAQEKWNKALSVATVTTNSVSEKRTFYTALYHSMIAPILFNDHDQTYRGTDKKVYTQPGYDHYTVFSLWDTYRQWHPLMTLLAPQKVPDFVKSMLDIYEQQGKLPVWPLVGSETNCMVGYSAVPVLADAILKGFKGFDYEKAFQAMKTTAMGDEFGLQYLKKTGFIPAEQEVESVSKAMEYAIGDKCIAMVAAKLGHEEDRKYFEERAGYYKRYFDKNSRFVRGVMSDGIFREPFDPFNIVHMKSDFTEGNAWQYTFMVPQDLENYTALFGGKEAFLEKLDSLFVVSGDLGAEASPDVSGLIGMYAQGNEPEHHVPYIYSALGRPDKTAEKVKEITSKFYTDKPDGICGNDDCGQMSAWYVASAMGFYQVHPADGRFYVGTPHFSNLKMKVGGKTLNITAKNFGKDNIYIQKIILNGKSINRTYLTYAELAAGGNLVYEMGKAGRRL